MTDQLQQFSLSKETIKNKVKDQAAFKEATRVIESANKRIVHFVFNPKQKSLQSPFVKKLNLLLAGDLQQFEIDEHERFENYLEKFVEETLDEGEHNPVTYEVNENYELQLDAIKHISFAVANNPFYKIETEKYFPQALVINA